jgi:hypothetical protein
MAPVLTPVLLGSARLLGLLTRYRTVPEPAARVGGPTISPSIDLLPDEIVTFCPIENVGAPSDDGSATALTYIFVSKP